MRTLELLSSNDFNKFREFKFRVGVGRLSETVADPKRPDFVHFIFCIWCDETKVKFFDICRKHQIHLVIVVVAFIERRSHVAEWDGLMDVPWSHFTSTATQEYAIFQISVSAHCEFPQNPASFLSDVIFCEKNVNAWNKPLYLLQFKVSWKTKNTMKFWYKVFIF